MKKNKKGHNKGRVFILVLGFERPTLMDGSDVAGFFGSPYRAEATAAQQREINNPDTRSRKDFCTRSPSSKSTPIPSWDPPAYDSLIRDFSQEYLRKSNA